MGIVACCTLRAADTMRVMTLVTWNIFFHNMFPMYILAKIIV
jgi:hypothetical protein